MHPRVCRVALAMIRMSRARVDVAAHVARRDAQQACETDEEICEILTDAVSVAVHFGWLQAQRMRTAFHRPGSRRSCSFALQRSLAAPPLCESPLAAPPTDARSHASPRRMRHGRDMQRVGAHHNTLAIFTPRRTRSMVRSSSPNDIAANGGTISHTYASSSPPASAYTTRSRPSVKHVVSEPSAFNSTNHSRSISGSASPRLRLPWSAIRSSNSQKICSVSVDPTASNRAPARGSSFCRTLPAWAMSQSRPPHARENGCVFASVAGPHVDHLRTTSLSTWALLRRLQLGIGSAAKQLVTEATANLGELVDHVRQDAVHVALDTILGVIGDPAIECAQPLLRRSAG